MSNVRQRKVRSLERSVFARSIVGSAVVVAAVAASSARANAEQLCAVCAAGPHAQATGAAASALQSLRAYRFAPAAKSQRERTYKQRALVQNQHRWRAPNARVSAGEHNLALNARRMRMKT
jgi:hypothetical protein